MVTTSAKKRNKNTNMSYNKMDQSDNAVDISSYINNLNYSTNMGPLNNLSMALDSAHFNN